MELAQSVCKNIQSRRIERRIKPTSADLQFDYTLASTSICMQCVSRPVCEIAALLNLPVTDCTYFARKQIN
ncbi:MAG: hypothetical protein DSZ23_03175 [Thermodesulfatator sp.]|nr:MAG: hypothetical protein DSZ23_03175 [Thermodesulfatator sp.]